MQSGKVKSLDDMGIDICPAHREMTIHMQITANEHMYAIVA